MKIFSLFLLTVVLFSHPLNLSAQPYEGEKGDVNNDGNINVLDMLRLANHILEIAILDEMEFWRADVNGLGGNCVGDGSVNVIDMVKIANIILGQDECPNDTVTDIDGNVYRTVTIGIQVWMAENLKVTHYRNGDPIPNVTDSTEWGNLTTGAYCNYDNDADNVSIYGQLYNWYAVDDSRGIAPAGWHVPTDEELKQLEMHMGMSRSEADDTGMRGSDEGGKLKEAGTAHWNSPNTGATNESGFSALPGGHRGSSIGYFGSLGKYAYIWSSTEHDSRHAWGRCLGYDDSKVFRDYNYKRHGFSIRCARD